MKRPPALDMQAFSRLTGIDEEETERRFAGIVSAFHSFLNGASVVADLQTRRSKWTSPRSPEAFQNRKFEPAHWYTFNFGGRSEAQLNVGMYPSHLRIGIGFEFTEREHGDPKHVREAFTRFFQGIHENRDEFDMLAQDLPLELEVFPGRGGGFQIVHPLAAVDTLLDLPREPQWIFAGRLLRPEINDEILTDSERLAVEIDRVFGRLLPWWERANGAKI